jgi:hypothetical protein
MDKRFIKGLFKDTAHIDQPEGTWRYAKNAIVNNKKGSISNEGGTELAGHLGNNQFVGAQDDLVIGKIEVNNNRVILFVKEINIVGYKRSEIGIWEDNVYTILYNPNIASTGLDLKFSEEYPIEGTFKIDSKGDLVIYFTDDLNPPRAFNVDRQLRSLPGGSPAKLYGSIPNDIELLNLFPHSGSIPHVELDSVSTHQSSVLEGGGLLTAVYYLALAYVDDDFVATNFVTVSNPISIVEEFDHTTPTTKKDGAKQGSQTTKAIKWVISNLNIDYKYLKPVVIRKMGDATDGFRLNDVEVSQTTLELTFSGIEGTSPASVEDVIIDTVSYSTAKTIQQLDNVLYLGNLTSNQDLGYQKYANNIKLNSVTRLIENFDEYYATVDNLNTGFNNTRVNEYGGQQNTVDHTKSYRYAPNIFKYKGYMRDEVYAFYIAFILNDGSMSYAYHIPGREGLEEEKLPAGGNGQTGALWNDIKDLNKKYAKNFHFLDRTALSPAATWSQHRQMNFWKNATELYPSTSDYEIWDGDFGSIGTLQGENVRHHHFPSNKNSSRKTIITDHCETAAAQQTPNGIQTYNNVDLTFEWDEDVDEFQRVDEHSWTTYRFNSDKSHMHFSTGVTGQNLLSAEAVQAKDALWNSAVFTADQQMVVQVAWNVWFHQRGGNIGDVKTRLMTNAGGTGDIELNQDTIGSFGSSPCAGTKDDVNRVLTLEVVTLEAGEKIWLETQEITSKNGYATQSNMGPEVACYPGVTNNYVETDCSGNGGMNCKSWIAFNIQSTFTQIPLTSYNDAKISHDVEILGFNLDSVKIPQNIANKIQGFRIYHAKRNHSDKTILGQSVIIPATPHKDQIGICQETNNNADALKILTTLKNEKENFWSINPYSKSITQYAQYPQMELLIGNTYSQVTDEYGYKVFSFHDFNLLRTRNSLSSATHIDIQYKVKNLAWNGAKIEQEKKMVSSFQIDDANQSIPRIVENWGWDTEFNCYPQDVRSAILIGCQYNSVSNKVQPRLINQKAKTYLPGDSIFEGEPLGFGGKLFNEFGESSIVFSLKDNHEIPVQAAQSRPYNGNVGWPYPMDWPEAGQYGVSGLGEPVLTNPIPWVSGGNVKSNDLIVNIKAFKTDVYKSIDSQDLVWTGFEVLGEDLEYFKTSNAAAHFDTNQLTTVNGEVHDGIYGGDTYICRYGIAAGLKPSNPSQESNPERAIHYHIVESTDNINFRHSQDNDSSYFPATPATKMLQYAGIRDFSSFDNMRYNDNYSELNNLRTAFPLPLKQVLQDNFPTRTVRSAKADTTSLIDNYRIFLANQFKDLPKNRGDLWKLSSFNNLLYFHMEESLFAAKGKQSMSMKDGSEAFVGSGDIFQQDPDELVQTKGGYAGTHSQWAALTTKFGYFFVDSMSRKVFLMGEQLQEISSIGMEEWFKENLKFILEEYGYDGSLDNPLINLGFISTWDPKNRRIILTKKDMQITRTFKSAVKLLPNTQGHIRWNSNAKSFELYHLNRYSLISWNSSHYFVKTGWTISFHPESSTWTSFHDYVPYLYFSTSTNFYSLTDKYIRPIYTAGVTSLSDHAGTTFGNVGIWKHNSITNKGVLYQENTIGSITNSQWLGLITYHSFELEFIHNENKGSETLISNLSYTAETFNQKGISILNNGFTDFLMYNTLQVSGQTELEYMVNTRRIGNSWTINKFRDMAAISLNINSYYMSSNTNLLGGTNTGTVTTSAINNMFNVNGMYENVNLLYIDLNKTWDKQRKFTDKWIGIRLICDNKQNNLLNLYSTSVGARKVHR